MSLVGHSEEQRKLLSEWEEYKTAHTEALDLVELNPDDDDVTAMVDELRETLIGVVGALNAFDKKYLPFLSQPTPNIDMRTRAKPLPPTIHDPSRVVTAEPAADPNITCLFPHAAPLQVYFDRAALTAAGDVGRWYSCVILAVVEPKGPIDRTKYRVWILGYNVEEVVYSEDLRKWVPNDASLFTPGAPCFAIDSSVAGQGLFYDALLDKVTPLGTVFVKFLHLQPPPPTSSPDAAPPSETVLTEIPVTHIQLGKFHRELRRRLQLTDEQKARLLGERKAKKREREEERKQIRDEKVGQKAADFQNFMEEMF